MKYIKLFESYNFERVKKNIEDMLVELKDDNINVSIFNSRYTQKLIDNVDKNYIHNGSIFNFIKEPCNLVHINISKNIINDGDEEPFMYKKEYDDIIEMVNEYIKEVYNLEDNDVFYDIDYHCSYSKDNLVDYTNLILLRVCYIIRHDIL